MVAISTVFQLLARRRVHHMFMFRSHDFALVRTHFAMWCRQEEKFLPVEIEAAAVLEPAPIDVPMPSPSAPLSARRIDITLSDGRRILVEGPTPLAAVISLVQGLSV